NSRTKSAKEVSLLKIRQHPDCDKRGPGRTVLAQFLLNTSQSFADVTDMHSPKPTQDRNPLTTFAKASLEKPGMYLIALRSHVGRGKSMIGQVLSSVARSLPQPEKVEEPDIQTAAR